MMLYKNVKTIVCSPDDDMTSLSLSLEFINYLDYMLRVSIDLIKGNGFTLKKKRSKQYPAKTMIDADYEVLVATPTRHQLYGHLPPITKTIQVRRARYAGHCWRSRDELISAVLLWTPTYGRAKAGRPARTCIQQLYEDTGCSPEDLPEAMNDREKWRERVRDIRASSTTWWWWLSIAFCKYTYPNWIPASSCSYHSKIQNVC